MDLLGSDTGLYHIVDSVLHSINLFHTYSNITQQ